MVGCEEGVSGVGVLVAERWIDSVIEVKRASERVMVLRLAIGKTVINVVSVHAPQVGRTTDEEFYLHLGKVLRDVGEKEMLIVCGDMNGHVVVLWQRSPYKTIHVTSRLASLCLRG